MIARSITILFFATILAACSTSARYEVTRFHELSAPAGETVKIVPASPGKEESLEFHQYAEMVGRALGQQGFRPGPDQDAPDYLVKIAYGAKAGPVVREDSPFSVGVGVGHHGGSTGVGVSTAIGFGDREYQYFTHWFDMQIVRGTSGEVAFEGHVETGGRERNLPQQMPRLIEAMFTNFPGQSGKTQTVRMENGY